MSARPSVDGERCLAAARAAPGARTTIAALLEAQFHHMGREVTHPDGNVLARLGLVRQAPPRERRTAVARYVGTDGARLVAVWPFALCVGDRRGGALLPRRGRASWWPLAAQPDCFTARELGLARAGCAPCPDDLVARALRWIASYEARVEGLVGTAHRAPADPRARAAAGGDYALAAAWRVHADALAAPAGIRSPGPGACRSPS